MPGTMETIIKRHCIVREEPLKNPGWSANLGSPQIPGSNTNPKNKTPDVFHTVPEKMDGLEDVTSSPFEKWHLFRCYWYLTLREGRFSCFFEPQSIHVWYIHPHLPIFLETIHVGEYCIHGSYGNFHDHHPLYHAPRGWLSKVVWFVCVN